MRQTDDGKYYIVKGNYNKYVLYDSRQYSQMRFDSYEESSAWLDGYNFAKRN